MEMGPFSTVIELSRVCFLIQVNKRYVCLEQIQLLYLTLVASLKPKNPFSLLKMVGKSMRMNLHKLTKCLNKDSHESEGHFETNMTNYDICHSTQPMYNHMWAQK